MIPTLVALCGAIAVILWKYPEYIVSFAPAYVGRHRREISYDHRSPTNTQLQLQSTLHTLSDAYQLEQISDQELNALVFGTALHEQLTHYLTSSDFDIIGSDAFDATAYDVEFDPDCLGYENEPGGMHSALALSRGSGRMSSVQPALEPARGLLRTGNDNKDSMPPRVRGLKRHIPAPGSEQFDPYRDSTDAELDLYRARKRRYPARKHGSR